MNWKSDVISFNDLDFRTFSGEKADASRAAASPGRPIHLRRSAASLCPRAPGRRGRVDAWSHPMALSKRMTTKITETVRINYYDSKHQKKRQCDNSVSFFAPWQFQPLVFFQIPIGSSLSYHLSADDVLVSYPALRVTMEGNQGTSYVKNAMKPFYACISKEEACKCVQSRM